MKLIGADDLAIWTTAHDANRTLKEVKAEEGFTPGAQFLRDDLKHHRVIVVTHAFYKGPRGSLARFFGGTKRTLTIVDERPQEVSVYDIDQGDVLKARDWAATEYGGKGEAIEAFAGLHGYLDETWGLESSSGKAFRALKLPTHAWFRSSQARGVLISQSDSVAGQVIGFAQALHDGYAFMRGSTGIRRAAGS